MTILQNGLIIAGLCLLFAALFPVKQLIGQLPPGRLRRGWWVLTTLIVCFIGGYVAYGIIRFGSRGGPLDLVVPAIFFLGACFVLLVIVLSAQTARDTGRIALLEHENTIDPLMGIYNRRHLERRLREEVVRAQRFGLPLSVLLVDVDRFKHINDTYGHRAGDLVLSSVAGRIAKTVRSTDIVARYGGDEILVIGPNTSLESASQLGERLRQATVESCCSSDGATEGHSISCTVSVGVAVLEPGIGDSLKLLSRVDEALYHAKQDGRNRVATSEGAGVRCNGGAFGESDRSQIIAGGQGY
jgi:diguanylate cyclase (GGDEF)-like protein